jgi:hypothetical protein
MIQIAPYNPTDYRLNLNDHIAAWVLVVLTSLGVFGSSAWGSFVDAAQLVAALEVPTWGLFFAG